MKIDQQLKNPTSEQTTPDFPKAKDETPTHKTPLGNESPNHTSNINPSLPHTGQDTSSDLNQPSPPHQTAVKDTEAQKSTKNTNETSDLKKKVEQLTQTNKEFRNSIKLKDLSLIHI